MYITDIKKEFFDKLSNCDRVLVFANFDVDSVCAVKIFQTLLKYDHIMFSVVPVQGKTDLLNAFKEHVASFEESDGQRFVVLVNCGGTMDIVDFLDPAENLVFFVADSHRPTDVCNIYSDGQVRLLMKQEEDEDPPDYDDIFHDSDDEADSEDEDEDENTDENGQKKARFDETAILKRRERRLWEEKRTKLLFEYQQFSFYGASSSLLMFELAWKMSRDTNDLLWWAIVGHTEQLLTVKTQTERYVMANANIRDHVSRLNITAGNGDGGSEHTQSVDCMKLSFEKELNLNLYRHWSIYESLCHTMYTASKFKIWTLKGKQRLSEFLVEVGLPLVQCKQRFSTMDLELRNDIVQVFEEKADKYGLDEVTYGSFVSNYGYRNKYCAADAVYATLAIMEQNWQEQVGEDGSSSAVARKKVATPESCFYEACDCLSRTNINMLETGIKKGRDLLSLIMKQVQNFLDLRLIISAGPFLYTIIREGTPDSKQFSKPNTLGLLAHFTLRAHVAITSSKKVQNLPLVLSAPLDESKGTCLVLGIPPVSDRSRKNLLGKAFEQAAKRTNSRYLLDYFDASVIQLKTEDRSKFFDGLISLLS